MLFIYLRKNTSPCYHHRDLKIFQITLTPNLPNSIGYEIDESDLMCASPAPR
jgi:hypothetical protein